MNGNDWGEALQYSNSIVKYSIGNITKRFALIWYEVNSGMVICEQWYVFGTCAVESLGVYCINGPLNMDNVWAY